MKSWKRQQLCKSHVRVIGLIIFRMLSNIIINKICLILLCKIALSLKKIVMYLVFIWEDVVVDTRPIHSSAIFSWARLQPFQCYYIQIVTHSKWNSSKIWSPIKKLFGIYGHTSTNIWDVSWCSIFLLILNLSCIMWYCSYQISF